MNDREDLKFRFAEEIGLLYTTNPPEPKIAVELLRTYDWLKVRVIEGEFVFEEIIGEILRYRVIEVRDESDQRWFGFIAIERNGQERVWTNRGDLGAINRELGLNEGDKGVVQ